MYEIAEGIGISSRHVRRCKKEVNLLRHQLTEPSLQPGEIQFLLSLLNRQEPDQQEIAQHFQKQIGVSPIQEAFVSSTPMSTHLGAGSRSGN